MVLSMLLLLIIMMNATKSNSKAEHIEVDIDVAASLRLHGQDAGNARYGDVLGAENNNNIVLIATICLATDRSRTVGAKVSS